MYLNILNLLILDAVEKVEGWVESAVVDNEESPLKTMAGLCLALLIGLWRRWALSFFRFAEGRRDDREERKPGAGSGNALEVRFDVHGRLLDMPQGAEGITGLSREAMVGLLFSRFLPDRDMPSVVEGFLKVLRGEDVRGLRIRLRTKGDAWMPAALDLFPVIRSGEITGVLGMLTPLAGRPVPGRTPESRPGSCVYVCRKGEMLYVNSRFAESSGYDRGEISAVDPLEIVHPADRLRVRRSNIRYLKGNPPEPVDFRIITRDGRVRWVHARVRPIRFKGEDAVLGTFNVMPARETPLRPSGARAAGTETPVSYGSAKQALAGHR